MICKLIQLTTLNKDLELYRWGVKLLHKTTLQETETSYKLSDRCIPLSLYEKVYLLEDVDLTTPYRIISTDEEKGILELENYGEVSYSDVFSVKPPLVSGYYYCKLLFIYTCTDGSTIKSYSSPSFIKTNGYYVDLIDNEEYDFPTFTEDTVTTNKYVKLTNRVPVNKVPDIKAIQELATRSQMLRERI